MNISKKIVTILCGSLCGLSLCAAVQIEVNKDSWQVSGPAYKAASRKGYISSIKTGNTEFLAQDKNISAGSYLCSGSVPALQNITGTADSITGTNKFGKITYKFTDKEITCTYKNESDKKVHYYFIMNPAVATVIVDGAKMLEAPAQSNGNSFKWLIGQNALEFTAQATSCTQWKSFQIWQLIVPPGQEQTMVITPGKALDTEKFNKEAANTAQTTEFDYSAVSATKQIPLCMIGDSITWAGEGDCWRKELLKRIPNLAFIGTHSARYGYSHAGEGGDNTGRVIGRIKYIPDCPYYSILIGTNNNSVKQEKQVKPVAARTADSIITIVNQLLKKPGVKKVFLSSVLPCYTKNPLRDQCNSETNRILREKFSQVFPADKVVWIEYEEPLRKVEGWEQLIKLHPTPKGYSLIADIMAEKIIANIQEKSEKTVRPPESGVRVNNLMGKDNVTLAPVIAGWYTLSFTVKSLDGQNPEVIIASQDKTKKFQLSIKVPVQKAGERVMKNFFTQYERYGYSRDRLTVTPVNCSIENILLEKTRPSEKASVFGHGSYIDSESPVSPGELIEYTPNKE